ncbi:MAG: sulfatase-like hydrolase/transferase [Boseongicola sp. SB0664_bin_43]|uniref:Sulfatase-like hydrolase/transferase n=1 Tax=Boseongicola sp. SB0664_bin_43 TaxID=2604844 RepID=A0A6B0Y4M2_9RHOB|nr:sulfatase-like hydrolase/transferase [Boseongicola sp. SB0664_bin_43]
MTSNFLIIMSDEHQARALGCAAHPLATTPNLDKLASQGVRFTNAYTPSPICVPARASFATGRHVHQLQCWDNAMPYTGSVPGWGHALQDKGIAVESIGKLHYRDESDPTGFDRQHVPMHVKDGIGQVWGSVRRESERVARAGDRMLGPHIGPGESGYTQYDDAVTRRTERWLAKRAASGDDGPWCLFVGLVAPHFPLVVPQPFFDMYPVDRLPQAKLHPSTGYRRHPWVEAQNALMNNEERFRAPAERLAAMSAYYGLCSWMDHNVGRILSALEASGMKGSTTIAYTSDHGDNVGARGLWGKSNFYEESVAVPLIMAGPDMPRGTCDTPVSLLDLSRTVAEHFGCEIDAAAGTESLAAIAARPAETERAVFSEYHAVGSVSGGFMLRRGRWKLNCYVGFEPELFDLEADPEELTDLAPDPGHSETLSELETELRAVCDLEEVNARAFADQDELIARHGGREAALGLGAPGATPPPENG